MIYLHTKRLIIRDNKEEDLNEYFRLLSNDTAMKYLPNTRTSSYVKAKDNLKVSISESLNSDRSKFFFAIESGEDNKYIGQTGYTVIDNITAGLGYFILPEYWNKGIVTEATTEVIRFAFEEKGILKIVSGCHKENKASEIVMQKLGMIKVKDIGDRLEYSLLREDWLDTK